MVRFTLPGQRAALRRAARLIESADGLLVGAGAGMSVESGIAPYRGPGGLWRSHDVDGDGFTARQRASAGTLHTHPDTTLDHYAHLWQQAQGAAPHEGYRRLVAAAAEKPAGMFVYTSNIDRLFVRAGLAATEVYECHGSLASSQCLRRCGSPPWPTPETGPSPCPGCGERGRPNVLLFDDYDFDGSARQKQWGRWGAWLADRRDARLVVLEIGAGTTIPTVRHRSEAFAAAGLPLIRVNPDRAEGGGEVSLPLGAVAALTALLR